MSFTANFDDFTPFYLGPFEIHCWKKTQHTCGGRSVGGGSKTVDLVYDDFNYNNNDSDDEVFLMEEEIQQKQQSTKAKTSTVASKPLSSPSSSLDRCSNNYYGMIIYENGIVVDPSIDSRFKSIPVWNRALLKSDWFDGKLSLSEVNTLLEELRAHPPFSASSLSNSPIPMGSRRNSQQDPQFLI